VQRAVRAAQPGFALRSVRADQGVERTIDAHQQQGELALLAARVDASRAGNEARHAGLAHPENAPQISAGEVQQVRRAQERLRQDDVGLGLSGGCRARAHQLKDYHINISIDDSGNSGPDPELLHIWSAKARSMSRGASVQRRGELRSTTVTRTPSRSASATRQ